MRKTTMYGRAVAVLLLVSMAAGSANAQSAPADTSAGGGLLVSPTYVLFDKSERSQSLILTNRGDKPATYRITLVNRRQMPDGQLVAIDQPAGDAGFAAPLVLYTPRQVVLDPDKPQTVRLLLHEPPDLPDGEYRSHILLQQVPAVSESDASAASNTQGLKVDIRAIFGITVPLVVRKGDLTATASLSALKPVRLPDGRNAVSLQLARLGSRSLRGNLTVSVDGEPSGWLNGVNVFLSTPYRELVIPVTTAGELQGHRLTVEFHESDGVPDPAAAQVALTP